MKRLVHWGDCTPAGAVFYPTYFKWFDEATWEFFEGIGLPIAELGKRYGVVGLPLMGCDAEFRGPCRLGDTLVFDSSIATLEETGFTVLHRIRNDGKLAVVAHERRFWGVPREEDPRRLKRGLVPPDVAAILASYMTPPAA